MRVYITQSQVAMPSTQAREVLPAVCYPTRPLGNEFPLRANVRQKVEAVEKGLREIGVADGW